MINLVTRDYSRKQALIELIIQELREKTIGENIDTVYDIKPSRKYFVGNLSPTRNIEQINNVVTKIAPTTLGFDTLIDFALFKKESLDIRVEGVFYYRVFPTFEEQKEFSERCTINTFFAPMGNDDDYFESLLKIETSYFPDNSFREIHWDHRISEV